MASARIPLDRTKPFGAKIGDVLAAGALYRARMQELANEITGSAGYASDSAAIQADALTSAGTAAQATSLINLVVQSNNELNGIVSTTLTAGTSTSGTKQLEDAAAIGF